MTIRDLISTSAPHLKPLDTAEHALGLLMELRVRHLPVVDEGMLVGVISEDLLLENASGPDANIESLLGREPVSAEPDTHLFDVTKTMVEHDLTTLPIAEADGTYVGLVKRHDIFNQFAKMLSTQESGAIVALEVNPRDYSLSKLVYTIEQNGVKILSIASEAPESETGQIRVTLKLNVKDATRVRHMLEHYGYHVVATFSDEAASEDIQARVQEFMRYLEV
ncbi:MAG: CBS domain-containing protein [Rhodothermales bacterium]